MLHGFYKKTLEERRQAIAESGFELIDALAGVIGDESMKLDTMAENVIGACRLPLGILTGLIVNGEEHCVAMATEEPSVIAAVNRVAGLFNASDGIRVSCEDPVTAAQIMFVVSPECFEQVVAVVKHAELELLDIANRSNPGLVAAGGGAFELNIVQLEQGMMVMTLHVHTRDAMGANAVNTMAEAIQCDIERRFGELPGFQRGMAILSNDGTGRMVHAEVLVPRDVIERKVAMNADDFIHRIHLASLFAERSSERAITHNKGILNGLIAASLPLGQDTRAMQAAIYDHACRSGKHAPLARWFGDDRGLVGAMDLPIVAGFVGGFRRNPAVEAAFEFDGIRSYCDLCSVLAGTGLAQNLGALWALMTEGIQAGHMRLHERKL